MFYVSTRKECPKTICLFFLKRYFRKQRKQANCFLKGTVVKLHSAIKLFCLRQNKNDFIAKRSSGFQHFVQCKTCLHFVFGERICLHLFLTLFYVDLLTRLLVELLKFIQTYLQSNFHVVMLSCYHTFMLSKIHVVMVSRFQGFMLSRFQGFKVSCCQDFKISRFYVVKVAILLETNLSIIKNFYQFIRIYC